MLFKADTLEAIARGRVTLAFRYWRRPSVRAGGRLRTAICEIAKETVEPITPTMIGEADARRAGCADRADLLRRLG
ncbi:MAG: hypothetical protein RLO50_16305, partial [Azospirillaceae bacterium]